MPKFQVSVTLTGYGYLDVEAADEEDARKKVRAMDPAIDFRRFHEDVDTALCDEALTMTIDGVVEYEGDEAPV